MRPGRLTAAGAAALIVAVLPGALQFDPPGSRLERVAPMTQGVVGSGPAVAAAMAALPPADDVPIIPPDDGLSGALAPQGPAPELFRPNRATSVSGRNEVFALVIGINDYPGDRSDLAAAVADADTIDAALAGFGVPAGNRVVLRDGQARRDQIVEAIRALVHVAGPDATVVFAYAGHVRKLARHTEAMVAADGGLIRDSLLAELLAPLRTQTVWLLMASCYAGGFTEAMGPGRVLTGASDAESLAYESPSINGSYLVHHLVREGWLHGGAGPSVQEAYSFAHSRIQARYRDRDPIQIDQSGRLVRLGEGDPSNGRTLPDEPADPPPPGAPTDQSPPSTEPPSAPPTTEPPRRCTALVLCRRS